MKLLLLLIMFTSEAFASEVAIIDDSLKSAEIQFTFTDENLFQLFDKQFFAPPCKSRTNMVSATPAIRENFVNRSCKAEVVKFLINAGYKPIDFGKTFVK